MNKRFKELTIELTDQLLLTSSEFMLNKLNGEENAKDLLNLVLSAGLSSIFSCMLNISNDTERGSKQIKKFISDIENFICSLDIIDKVETFQ